MIWFFVAVFHQLSVTWVSTMGRAKKKNLAPGDSVSELAKPNNGRVSKFRHRVRPKVRGKSKKGRNSLGAKRAGEEVKTKTSADVVELVDGVQNGAPDLGTPAASEKKRRKENKKPNESKKRKKVEEVEDSSEEDADADVQPVEKSPFVFEVDGSRGKLKFLGVV